MKENNFNFTNGVSYDVWHKQKRLIEELKNENKGLKKKLELLLCTETVLQIGYTAYKKQIEYILKENDRYRKALEEIEEEIKKYQCDNCEDYHCASCDMKDILNIINKAKGEGNE